MTKRCNNCGYEADDMVKFCRNCGAPLPEDSSGDMGGFSLGQNNSKIFVIGLVVLAVILIVSFSSMFGSSPEDSGSDVEHVNISITEMSSDYLSNDSGGSFSYDVGGYLYPSESGKDLSDYVVRVTYYNNNETITMKEGFISFYDVNEFTCYYFSDYEINVTDVKVEVINTEGTLVGTAESSFL